MATYDSTQEIPKLTPARESIIGARLGRIRQEELLEGSVSDTKWFEARLIEAILAAATSNPLKTVGDAWGRVSFRITNSARMKGWNEAKMQAHLATAADVLIRLMSA